MLYGQELEIKIAEDEPYYVPQEINVEIYLLNTSADSLTYFNSLGPSWDSFNETWELSANYKAIEVLPMNGAFDHKFPDSTIITLPPGEKKLIRTHTIPLKTEGFYSLTYTQEQSPEFVSRQNADMSVTDSIINKITRFKVSKNLKFRVYEQFDTTIYKKNSMTWDEWREYRNVKVFTRDHYFDNIYAALKKPQDVYSLDMYCNGFTAEDIRHIGRLKNLKALKLYFFDLDSFPAEIANLNLFELTILPKNEKAIDFSAGISNNHTLRELRVKLFGPFPEQILSLNKLTTLDISDGNVSALPDLSALENLEVLNVNNNDIGPLQNVNLNKLTHLSDLDLSGNKKIDDITPLLTCTNLEFLVLTRTSIPEIPSEIEDLDKLKRLSVSNKLTTISDSLGNLTDMRYLSFSGNRNLDSIPYTIIRMKNLLHFDMSRTNVKMLPTGISELPLEKVMIYNTPCEVTKDYKELKKRLKDDFKE